MKVCDQGCVARCRSSRRHIGVALALLAAFFAFATPAVAAEPIMAHPIGSALGWIEGALLGTIATAVAVLAIAWIGFLMLSGRLDIRRAAHVVLGCFIIFGASTIAAGIQGTIFGRQEPADQPNVAPPPPAAYPTAPAQAAPSAYDPYAGAGLPPSR